MRRIAPLLLGRQPLRHLPALAIASFAVTVAAQAPTPIVERLVEVGERTVRTSLFSNRVAVVSVRLGEEQVALRQMTLDRDEYTGYLAALQRDADELADADQRSPTDSMGGRAEITLHIGPHAPRTLHYSPMAVLDLATSRLVGALDDLEHRVIWGEPSAATLGHWQPRRGDRVELRTGVRGTVIEVRDDGVIVVEHDNTWINEVIPPQHRASVILRVIEDDR